MRVLLKDAELRRTDPDTRAKLGTGHGAELRRKTTFSPEGGKVVFLCDLCYRIYCWRRIAAPQLRGGKSEHPRPF